MREFAKVSPQIWTSNIGRKIKNLGNEGRIVSLYLLTNPMKSGATADEYRAVIARKYRDWHDTDMQKYLRPATLFNPIKFEQYLGECVVIEEILGRKCKEGSQNESK